MSKFNTVNIYKIHLILMKSVYEYGTLERILEPIGNAIKISENQIDNTKSKFDAEYFESVEDYETEIIENLLGTAFVACQTYITNMVSRIYSLHKFHNAKNGHIKLLTTKSKKSDILSFGECAGNTKFSKVQIIDSFANYYKHRDEWKSNWGNASGQSINTIKILKGSGAKSGSTGNLRAAAEILENKDYHSTEIFAEIINDWGKKLYNGYYQELKKHQLV